MRIKNFHSAAAFHDEDSSQPVAWILQYPSGMIGPLYTMEAHRRKGLGLALAASLCQAILEETPNIPPYCDIDLAEESSMPSANLFERLGFVRAEFPLRHYVSIGVNLSGEIITN